MPLLEDSDLEDVPNLLRNGNEALAPWTAQQHFLFKLGCSSLIFCEK